MYDLYVQWKVIAQIKDVPKLEEYGENTKVFHMQSRAVQGGHASKTDGDYCFVKGRKRKVVWKGRVKYVRYQNELVRVSDLNKGK